MNCVLYTKITAELLFIATQWNSVYTDDYVLKNGIVAKVILKTRSTNENEYDVIKLSNGITLKNVSVTDPVLQLWGFANELH